MFSLSKEYQDAKQKMLMNLYEKKQNDIQKMNNELCLLKGSEKISREHLEKYINIYQKKAFVILNKLV
tara:strand:- start:235 stop:438 length:204 start_codon:yes stop_codon:yes gene_type:complete